MRDRVRALARRLRQLLLRLRFAVLAGYRALPIDGWDVVGCVGLGLVVFGVAELRGGPLASILLGSVLMFVYALREVRLAMGNTRRNG